MARFTHRIDRHFSDAEGWGIESDDARGAEDYDGPAKEYAREVAQNRYADLLSLSQVGEWRVLVWEGDEEGSEDDADVAHFFTVTEEDLKPRGGRPKIGNIVSVAMGSTLPRVDAYAEKQGIKRAKAIRQLVILGLGAAEAYPVDGCGICGRSEAAHGPDLVVDEWDDPADEWMDDAPDLGHDFRAPTAGQVEGRAAQKQQ